MPVNPPLTPKDGKEIKAAIARLNDLTYEIDRAKAVGVDTSEAEMRRDAARETLVKMVEVYFT